MITADCARSHQSTTMYRISVICTIVHLLTTATASPPVDVHKTELFEHYKHVEYISDFPCGVPQPRVFSVNDLFCDAKLEGKAYFPDVTVLYRCDNTGCCASGQVCGPNHVETLHLPFKITFLEDIAYHKKGSWFMEYFDLTNHTECSCMDPPTPLTFSQEPTEPSVLPESPHTQHKTEEEHQEVNEA